ncbi:6-phosphofructo-2-kinase [Coniosporium tulheliwenetii]|uniref:6-phosphofructo-2-kinase n=1 Tax=Coniosporium tulheliwenetii TaxID=3383036 RepID=A0ACC2YWP0_9PEZI|nr:6-phosphofructo-2-kinase [Cladosporium sp. JES 115]
MLASYDSDSSRSSLTTASASFQQPTVKPADLEVEKRQQRGPGTESPSERFAKRVGMDSKLVIVMVGLPARGKSYVTKKLCRYLTWLQYETRIFNVGERRRTIAGRPLDPTASKQYSKPTNSAATILDEPEHSASFLIPPMLKRGDYGSGWLWTLWTIFLIICWRKAAQSGSSMQRILLEKNISLKLSGPDYIGQDPVAALKDFKKRVAMYEKKYAPIGDYEERNGLSFCQMIDVGRKFVTHKINGFLATQVVNYLQHFNLAPRQVWLTRHGESIDNIADQCPLSDDKALDGPDDLNGLNCTEAKRFWVWTSMMQRSIQTAQFFDQDRYEVNHMRMLDDLNAGMLEGLTHEQVKELYADEYEQRQRDKLRYRYLGERGEGYLDVTNRLKSVILELERVHDHVLLIAPQSVTRILLAYCRGLKSEEITDLHVPLGTLYMLEPKPYGADYKEFVYNPETDWFDLKAA